MTPQNIYRENRTLVATGHNFDGSALASRSFESLTGLTGGVLERIISLPLPDRASEQKLRATLSSSSCADHNQSKLVLIFSYFRSGNTLSWIFIGRRQQYAACVTVNVLSIFSFASPRSEDRKYCVRKRQQRELFMYSWHVDKWSAEQEHQRSKQQPLLQYV